MQFRIGMRNLKTALAVLICIFVSNLLGLEYPFYAAIAAIVAMQNSVEGSLKAGKNRMLGTFVGAATGYIFALIAPGNPMLCALGIVIVIYICNLLKWNDAISVGGIVLLAIMLTSNGKNPLYYSINRLLDTLIGVTVALVINYFVKPPKNKQNITSKI